MHTRTQDSSTLTLGSIHEKFQKVIGVDREKAMQEKMLQSVSDPALKVLYVCMCVCICMYVYTQIRHQRYCMYVCVCICIYRKCCNLYQILH